MNILYLGDVYGEMGIKAIEKYLPKAKKQYPYDLLLINGENVSGGIGLTKDDYTKLMRFGAHLITLGNHAFSKDEIFDYMDEAKVIRPLNFPKGAPGEGMKLINYNGTKVAILQVMGRIFMNDPLDNPFTALDQALENLEADIVLVDLHGEATSEKLALAHYLDGRVDAAVGTHTHVQTNDAMRLPGGTLYMSDIGMCGALHGILGADKDIIVKRFTTGLPIRMKPETSKALQMNGVYIDTDKK
ncbi:MAG: TIGR00282 family metallophosphoesterase, partial [Bacillota bacterium]